MKYVGATVIVKKLVGLLTKKNSFTFKWPRLKNLYLQTHSAKFFNFLFIWKKTLLEYYKFGVTTDHVLW